MNKDKVDAYYECKKVVERYRNTIQAMDMPSGGSRAFAETVRSGLTSTLMGVETSIDKLIEKEVKS